MTKSRLSQIDRFLPSRKRNLDLEHSKLTNRNIRGCIELDTHYRHVLADNLLGGNISKPILKTSTNVTENHKRRFPFVEETDVIIRNKFPVNIFRDSLCYTYWTTVPSLRPSFIHTITFSGEVITCTVQWIDTSMYTT
jgi:hypothetical protein